MYVVVSLPCTKERAALHGVHHRAAGELSVTSDMLW
jgi:hypothetical protein